VVGPPCFRIIAAAVAGAGRMGEIGDRSEYSHSYKPSGERAGIRIGRITAWSGEDVGRAIPVEYAEQGPTQSAPRDAQLARTAHQVLAGSLLTIASKQ
jgi:hypothetical protein